MISFKLIIASPWLSFLADIITCAPCTRFYREPDAIVSHVRLWGGADWSDLVGLLTKLLDLLAMYI